MAIEFNCPYCQHPYKLADKLAGKQAKCKNANCRKVITVPAAPEPTAIPAHLLRGPSTATIERAALAALSDEPPKQEAADKPPEEKVIDMTCSYCDHKWTEPWSKAGKNTLCPNPECRQRQKVPVPKEEKETNWREQKSGLPRGAKQNFEKLDNVQDAGEVRQISREAAEEAGLFEDLYEPRSLKPYIALGVAALGLFVGMIYLMWSWRSGVVERREDRLMTEARDEFDKKAVPEWTTAHAGLPSAVLHAAASQYALEKSLTDNKGSERLKEAQAEFDKARNELRKQPPSLDRHALATELAFAVFEFAGTDEQVKEQLRYRWQPEDTGRALRMNERPHTIHQELSTTLALLQPADFEFRLVAARRLTRELIKRGQVTLAVELLPRALFDLAENAEAKAAIALEIYRADKAAPQPAQIAEELKTEFGQGIRGNPYPVSAQVLFAVLGTDKAPLGAPPPPKTGPVQSALTVMAYVGMALLKEQNDTAAIDLAKRAAQPETQLKALTLCAEWSKDPAAALDAAVAVIDRSKTQKATLSPAHILRLSQIAASGGKFEQCKTLADGITDEGLKAWAKGDAARLMIVANPKQKADEMWVEVPDDPRKVRVGHAWGRMWIARQNMKESHDRDKEKKATASWPTTVHPFALAGIALGLHDK
ncbi:MAG: hypothetical protein U0792_03565 [Gemmataceae bacterium]